MTQSQSYGLVVIGAALWGCVGIFVTGLAAAGLSAIQIAWLRMAGGAVVLIVYLSRTAPQGLRLRSIRDLHYFVITGAVSIALFQWSYISAIRLVGISTAVVLLYTSPGFVVLLARLLYREPITPTKVICLAAMIVGVASVSGLFGGSTPGIGLAGILAGLSAGASFSLYSVIGKRALMRYGATTVTVYTFALATLALTPGALLATGTAARISAPMIGWGLGIVAIPTVAAYLFYTVGLKNVESGRAAIVSSVEVLVAAAVGMVFFGEPAGAAQLVGTAMVFTAAVAVQRSR